MSLYLGNNLISGVATPVEPTRNIGQIIQSTLPLVDAGLHLLDGSLILGGGIYQGFVDYIDNLYNDTKVYNPSAFTVVGSPNITDDGIASGFSSSNYLKFANDTFRPASNPWKLSAKVKTGATIPSIDAQTVVAINQSVANTDQYGINIQILNNKQAFNFQCYDSNGTVIFLETIGTVPLQANTEYLLGLEFTGTQYICYINGNAVKTINSTTTIAQSNSLDNYIGVRPISTTIIYRPFGGSIDLKQFSITVDGVEVLNGSKPAKYFTDETSWQASVTQYGVCGKFVYDSVNNTVRLPKITGIVEGASGVANLGDLTEAGLPNITGAFGMNANSTVSGVFVRDGWNGVRVGGANADDLNITFDASRSSSVYGNSNTVQPQTIKVLYYIVVATSSKTDIQVDIDEIATDLNGKADVDLSNVANTAGFRKLVEVYNNDTSWYKVFREYNPQNGSYVGLWCEQGGRFNANNTATTASYTVNLLKSYKDTNYSIVTCGYSNHADQFKNGVAPYSFTTSSFVIQTFNNDALQPIVWQASGYIEV